MPNLVIIRLLPSEPTTAAEFERYLSGLTLIAHDISFGRLQGQEIGRASYDLDRPRSRIVQHFTVITVDPPNERLHPVATAVVEIQEPIGWPEHRSSDIRLRILRSGQELRGHDIHYNVPVIFRDTLPQPEEYARLEPVGMHLALPPPGVGVDPGDPGLGIPGDGTPPRFTELRAMVEKVLSQDPGPGDPPDITRMTPAQCRHIASEIVWNHQASPLPLPPRPLEILYERQPTPDPFITADRKRFEAEVAAYYATHNAETERLSRYIFAMSAALFAEARSREANRVSFRFPVRPGVTGPSSHIREAEVILTP
jgi:hypothetical protein